MNPNPETTNLSPRQLAARWSFHEESVRRMVREGRLPAIRFRKHLRIGLEDIRAFELAHRTVSPGRVSSP